MSLTPCPEVAKARILIVFFATRRTAEVLMQESGCCLENPAATKFRQHVMAGDWIKADHYLQELMPMIEAKQPSIVVSFFYLGFCLAAEIILIQFRFKGNEISIVGTKILGILGGQ